MRCGEALFSQSADIAEPGNVVAAGVSPPSCKQVVTGWATVATEIGPTRLCYYGDLNKEKELSTALKLQF